VLVVFKCVRQGVVSDWKARVFIDASYDGDLTRRAGVLIFFIPNSPFNSYNPRGSLHFVSQPLLLRLLGIIRLIRLLGLFGYFTNDEWHYCHQRMFVSCFL
jgi:hypothetical protein